MYTQLLLLFHNSCSEENNKLKGSTKASLWLALWLAKQKQVISKPKQLSCKKKSVWPQKRPEYKGPGQGMAPKKVYGPQKGQGEKGCEMQGDGQEMAVMVG